jgi:hypothetical protein
MRAAIRCCLLALALQLQSCVYVYWQVEHVQEPIADGTLAKLEPGKDDLSRCLQLLGAPHFVWEYRGEGAALAWVSSDTSSWGVGVSYSFEWFFPSASFRWDAGYANLPGVVLWFDQDLRLERWKRGRMRDLISGHHHRPAEPEDGG